MGKKNNTSSLVYQIAYREILLPATSIAEWKNKNINEILEMV